MKDVYLVYETYDEEFREQNGYDESCNIIGIYNNYRKALVYIDNELQLQCENDDAWTYKKGINNDMICVDLYFVDEWQYSIYCKKMVVQ